MKKLLLIICFILIFSLTSCKKNVTLTYKYLDKEEKVEYKKGEDVTLKELELDHQIFNGWLLDGKKVTSINMDDNYTVTADLTSCLEVTIVVNNKEEHYKMLSGSTLSMIPDPTYNDLVFVGWYTDSSFTPSTYVSKERKIETDMKVYAKFNEKQFLVSYDTKGGTIIKSTKVYRNSTLPNPQTPYLLGYRFSYWSKDEEGKIPYDIASPVTSDFTLYANYDAVDYNGLIDEYVPDVINGNLEFPTITDELDLYWSTSDLKLVNSDGTVNPKRVDTTVVVTLEVYARGDYDKSLTFTKTAVVSKYNLNEIIPGQVVIGYTSYWYYKGYTKEILSTVDILDISFGYVNSNGTVDLGSVHNMMATVTSTAHNNGVHVCLSIQGYGDATKNFSDCAADPTLRHTLAYNMAKICSDYNLDGIDIDWEYPGSYSGRAVSADRVNFTLLIAEIRSELNKLGDGYLLTSAIPGGSWGAGHFEMDKLVQYFDYFNMMSYDCENPNSGSHHCALHPSTVTSGTASGSSVEEAVNLWVSLGVPKNKICLGSAFYGKSIAVGSSVNDGLGMPKTAQFETKYKNKAYADIVEGFFPDIGTNRLYRFDYSACAPFLFGTQTKFFTTYENELSLVYKGEYARSEGLAGMIIWELGEDGTNTLIKSVAQGIGKYLKDEAYLVGGNLTLTKNQTITVKVVNEVRSTKLLEDLIFYSTNSDIISIVDNHDGTASITLKNSGEVTLYASTSDKSTNYGIMHLTIE